MIKISIKFSILDKWIMVIIRIFGTQLAGSTEKLLSEVFATMQHIVKRTSGEFCGR